MVMKNINVTLFIPTEGDDGWLTAGRCYMLWQQRRRLLAQHPPTTCGGRGSDDVACGEYGRRRQG